jgi:methylthioribose-1-phosphate isomerase
MASMSFVSRKNLSQGGAGVSNLSLNNMILTICNTLFLVDVQLGHSRCNSE